MRSLTLGIVVGVGICTGGLPALAESVTTRIEPRPFYGATVTIEAGVRVFRPLPRHERIIIDPGYRAQLNLNAGDPAYRRDYLNGYRR